MVKKNEKKEEVKVIEVVKEILPLADNADLNEIRAKINEIIASK